MGSFGVSNGRRCGSVMGGGAGSIPPEVAVFLIKAKNENALVSIEMSAP